MPRLKLHPIEFERDQHHRFTSIPQRIALRDKPMRAHGNATRRFYHAFYRWTLLSETPKTQHCRRETANPGTAQARLPQLACVGYHLLLLWCRVSPGNTVYV